MGVEKYEKEAYPKVEEILKPYVITPVDFKHYTLKTTVCELFVEALAAEVPARPMSSRGSDAAPAFFFRNSLVPIRIGVHV